MNRKIGILFITILCIGCNRKTELEQLDWLQGKWIGHSTDGLVFIENWSKKSDKLLLGQSFGLQGEDTIYKEYPKMELIEGKLFYITNIPKVATPVLFKSSKTEGNTAVFENNENEFPTTIIYKKTGADSLHVIFEGKRNNEKAREALYFIKQK
jgi:hypothetical protein